MNKVILIGRITKDPEVGNTINGLYVCQFSLAVNREYKNQNGEYDADFISCVAWRGTAEYIGNYVKKGNLLSVVGSLQTRSYQDQNGQNRSVVEVIVESVKNLSPKENKAEPIEEFGQVNSSVVASDDDLPF